MGDGLPGRERRISRSDIRSVDSFDMGFWSGRYRLVGISPGRPRSWFTWDSSRRHKTTALVIDTGGFLQPTITPDEPDVVAELLAPTG